MRDPTSSRVERVHATEESLLEGLCRRERGRGALIQMRCRRRCRSLCYIIILPPSLPLPLPPICSAAAAAISNWRRRRAWERYRSVFGRNLQNTPCAIFVHPINFYQTLPLIFSPIESEGIEGSFRIGMESIG